MRRPPDALRTPPPELDRLTARELDVLRMMASALSNTAIATEFFVSETTVKQPIPDGGSSLASRVSAGP